MIRHFGKEAENSSHHDRGVAAGQRRDSDEWPPAALITAPPLQAKLFFPDTLYLKISKPRRLNGLKSISEQSGS